jgi:hypothetical protein
MIVLNAETELAVHGYGLEWGTSIRFLAIRHDSSKPFTGLR